MIKNTKLRSEGVKRARELIYTAERQVSRDVGLAGLRLKPGSSQLLLPCPLYLFLCNAHLGRLRSLPAPLSKPLSDYLTLFLYKRLN
jgi:hypothetical protein